MLGKADVARNYRRNVTRFKKKVREKKEREREREREKRRHVALRQFFLMDGVGVTVCPRFTRGDVAGIV